MDSEDVISNQQTINAEQQRADEGQRQINGQLCRVDWMLIETLRLLRVELAHVPGIPRLDFERIDAMLKRAYYTMAAVAEIKPPGCEPQFVADPNWTIEREAA